MRTQLIGLGTCLLLAATTAPGAFAVSASAPAGSQVSGAQAAAAGRIVFVRSKDGDALGIFVMKADGSAVRRIWTAPKPGQNVGTAVGAPHFSPDGSRIVFSVGYFSRDSNDTSGEYSQMFVMDADGAHLARLGTGDQEHSPVFSPDGERIAFVRNGGIALMRVDGRGTPVQLKTGRHAVEPSFSPDGKTIAYVRRNDNVEELNALLEICTIAVNGKSTRVRLTKGKADGSPAYSPDGKSILFQRSFGDEDPRELWVMRTDGTRERRITKGFLGDLKGREDFEPSYSPKGARMVFVRFNGEYTGDTELYTANPDGTKPVRLTRNGVDEYNPDWVGRAR